MRNFLYGLMYTAMGVTVIAVIFAFGSWYDAPGGLVARAGVWPFAALGAVAVLWLVAFRRDAYAAWLFLGLFGALAVPFLAVMPVLVRGVHTPIAIGSFVSSVGAFLIGCAGCAWIYWRKAPPDEVLAHIFGRKLGDMRGVLVLFDVPPQVPAGTVAWIRVYLENCWDAPRSVRFDVRLWNAAHKHLVRTDPAWKTMLGPRQAGVLHIPIGIASGVRGQVRLDLDPTVGGDAGRRVISRRGELVRAKVSTGFLIAMAAAGVPHHGGGVQLVFAVTGDAEGAATAPPKVDAPIFEPLAPSAARDRSHPHDRGSSQIRG